jgi:predicted DNA-binding transcriptional regulator AlpA
MPPIPPDQQPNAPPSRGPHDRETRPHGTQQQSAAQRDKEPAETANPPHQRQGDRASGDDADDTERKLAARRSRLAQSGFPIFVRYADLEAAGFVASWTQLLRMIDDEGFPPGVMIGPNTRAWRVDEVEAWLASRPTARKAVPPDAVHPRVRDKRRAAAEEALP